MTTDEYFRFNSWRLTYRGFGALNSSKSLQTVELRTASVTVNNAVVEALLRKPQSSFLVLELGLGTLVVTRICGQNAPAQTDWLINWLICVFCCHYRSCQFNALQKLWRNNISVGLGTGIHIHTRTPYRYLTANSQRVISVQRLERL